MNEISVTVCGEKRQLPAGSTLANAIQKYSPYGEEAVICRLNGKSIRSIDESVTQTLNNGDELEIFPLIIGG